MNTTEFLAQKIKHTEVSKVSIGSTCLVMLTKLVTPGTFNVMGSRHDIELEHYNRVFLLDEPPVLAKDLVDNAIFTITAGCQDVRRRRVFHVDDSDAEIFAPSITDRSASAWVMAEHPCTIISKKI